ncbi:hypothetical protein SNE40_000537 [Patella caerulea]|uniref:Chitin-binding type-2 domain-containing protein n=1 Tax=Patella caerulea TaxID=87958 RepID=A0AAN8KLH1_PATCE
MKLLVVVLALVAIQWQESSASTCSYSCRKSYRTYRRCGFMRWSRCSSTSYTTGTCYRSCTHGGYSNWYTTYGSCSKTCGGGIQSVTKKRYCTNPRPSGGGRSCSGSSYSYTTQRCNTQSCPVNGGWSLWSTPRYSSCSKSCGGGILTRTYTRSCSNPTPRYGGRTCSGSTTRSERVSCNTAACPIHGGFSSYRLTNTGACSKTCGGGVKQLTYTRSCSNPTPRYGGRSCVGATTKTQPIDCNTQHCPINGGWTDFTLDTTGECTVSCGGGTKTLSYSRTCTNPRPQYSGDDCGGASTKETQEECNTQHCPIHGGWTDYTLDTTGECTVSCGGGTKTLSYSRTCTNPRPQYGGDDCDGASTKETQEDCNTHNCPIHGGWTNYTLDTTGECTVSCGGGTKTLSYSRTCTNPRPQYGGDDCDGASTKETQEDCNTHNCPINGGWTDFTLDTTGDCSVSCGGGTKILSYVRTCTNPRPQYGGDECDGVNTKDTSQECNTHNCPINGGWTDFTEWEEINECDSLCGGGIKEEQRDRTCTNPSPAYGGDDCDGESSQVRNVTCNTELCGDKCPTGQNTYIAHTDNDYRYYQCAHGVARLRDCAAGTMWSQDDSVCINIPVAAAAAPTHAPVSTACDASLGLVADPSDCHNYRICAAGRYYTMACASGTAFNAARQYCDLLANVPGCN